MKGDIVKTTRHSLAAVLGIIVLAGGMALAQASDPLVGTWKLNVAKSKGTALKSGTTKVEKDGDGVKMTAELVRADGTPVYGVATDMEGVVPNRVAADRFAFSFTLPVRVDQQPMSA